MTGTNITWQNDAYVVPATQEGLGALFGGGYDVQIGQMLLTPNLDFLVQVIDDDTAVVGLLTIGLTWH